MAEVVARIAETDDAEKRPHEDSAAYQPVAKVADPAWPRRGRVSYTERHGNGQETGGATGVAAVGDDGGFADERRTSILRASEPGPGRGRIRRLRRGAVRGVLRGADGPAESASWAVFPDAVHRLLRGPDAPICQECMGATTASFVRGGLEACGGYSWRTPGVSGAPETGMGGLRPLPGGRGDVSKALAALGSVYLPHGRQRPSSRCATPPLRSGPAG